MAKVTLRVKTGCHNALVDGKRRKFKAGEIFPGDDSLLSVFGDKLEKVEAPAKAAAKKAAPKAPAKAEAPSTES